MGIAVATPYREPSIQHLAVALAQAGLLDPLYVPLDLARIMRLTRRRNDLLATRRLLAKRAYAVEGRSVAPLADVVSTVGQRLNSKTHAWLAMRAVALDRAVARQMRVRQPEVLVGMPYSSIGSFEEAKLRGVMTCLNHVNANLRTENAVFRQEAFDSPSREERQRILEEQWPESLCRRVDREVDAADLVLAPSRFVVDDLVQRGVEPARIELIPYGVDVQRFAMPERDYSARALEVLYVGQVGYRKGLRYLGEAVRSVSPEPKRITVIGPVVHRSPVLERSFRDVVHLGKIAVHELPRYYAAADVFVLPSLAEGMALVVLEAMAAGLPVIVTEESGYAGIVRSGIEGFIVPARDSRAIAEKLMLLSGDGELRRRMSLASRERAGDYSWSRFEQTALDAILSLLSRPV